LLEPLLPRSAFGAFGTFGLLRSLDLLLMLPLARRHIAPLGVLLRSPTLLRFGDAPAVVVALSPLIRR
jgi:hypothetical protein